MTFKSFLMCLALIESGNDPQSVGDNGKAVGALQIHPIMVDDVNRIAGGNFYSYDCRKGPERSKEMAAIYFRHHCGKKGNIAIMAARWNTGKPDTGTPKAKKYLRKLKIAANDLGLI